MSAPSAHLLTLWNPSYTDDALDAHLRVLLDWASARALGNAEEDEVYARRHETHLYLTDYRSLYVAHVGEITGRGLVEQLVRARLRSRD